MRAQGRRTKRPPRLKRIETHASMMSSVSAYETTPATQADRNFRVATRRELTPGTKRPPRLKRIETHRGWGTPRRASACTKRPPRLKRIETHRGWGTPRRASACTKRPPRLKRIETRSSALMKTDNSSYETTPATQADRNNGRRRCMPWGYETTPATQADRNLTAGTRGIKNPYETTPATQADRNL